MITTTSSTPTAPRRGSRLHRIGEPPIAFDDSEHEGSSLGAVSAPSHEILRSPARTFAAGDHIS